MLLREMMITLKKEAEKNILVALLFPLFPFFSAFPIIFLLPTYVRHLSPNSQQCFFLLMKNKADHES